ncbi:MAG: hypothetical protein PHS49_03280 [Candidatus Gracilibacteria bacterium]|nr:hypothetical protein [Candidatus Gracilibacteria bacterium]
MDTRFFKFLIFNQFLEELLKQYYEKLNNKHYLRINNDIYLLSRLTSLSDVDKISLVDEILSYNAECCDNVLKIKVFIVKDGNAQKNPSYININVTNSIIKSLTN